MKRFRIFSYPLAFALAGALAGCGGGGGAAPVPSARAAGGSSALTVRIDVPQTGTASNRRPAYVSPATQSIAITVLAGSVVIGTFSVNLTPSSSSCQTVASVLQCSITVPLALTAAGTYTLATATFDQPQTQPCSPTGTPLCAGNVLSASDVAATLKLNATNTVSMVLGGLANNFVVTPAVNGFFQGNVNALSLWGPQSQALVVQALDAAGNTIVGAGAPTLTLSSASPTALVTSTMPGAFTLAAATSGSPSIVQPGTVQLTATATPVGNPAAPFSRTIPLTIAHTALFVSNNITVAVYLDGNTTATTASIPGLTSPRGVAVDAAGTLYIGEHTSPAGFVVECTAPDYAACSTPISTSQFLEGVATDVSGNLWITANGSELIEFLAGQTTPAVDIPTGLSTLRGVVADELGNVWTANQSGPSEVAGFAPPFSVSSVPFALITSGVDAPIEVSADGSGNLWVANCGAGCAGVTSTAEQFAAPLSSASMAARTVGASAGITGAEGVAVDADSVVWIANTGANTVVRCAPPVSATTCTNFPVPGAVWIAVFPSAIDP